jgi:eukaryotic-like serine/threonine-protein kinase
MPGSMRGDPSPVRNADERHRRPSAYRRTAAAQTLRDLDLSPIFVSKLSAELPPEIFVRRSTRRYPGALVEPAHVSEPGLPQPGSVLGKYRLECTIGMGGFGAVYRARHVVLDNVVAIKLMRPSVARSRPSLPRLLTEEARFAARIDHANVVRVHDVATSNEHTYIVMEHVDGPDLSVMIRRRGALPYKVVARILRHIAAALAAGLAEQLIHRDVKPSNILLTRAGVTKLADFGLARSSSVAETTGPGAGIRGVVGTAAYMAPEQATDPLRVGFRSDIYSLGITAYHALTGKLPFSDHDVRHRADRPYAQPIPPPGRLVATIPAALDELILAMTALRPEDRPASYAILDAALRAIR